jgi:hypothetical protein
MRLRTSLAVAAATTTVGALAVPALAATATLDLSPATVHRGNSLVIGGTVRGCHDSVTLLSKAFSHMRNYAGVPSVVGPVDGRGRYRITVRIPSTRRIADYEVSGRCGGANIGVTRTLHVIK